jgi:N6-adenosine-specific RNA methylase IME4
MIETALVHLTQARQALQKAKTIDEVKAVRDNAERLRLYLKQSKESLEMQNDAAEIGLRAERRAGEMLKEGERRKADEGRPKKGNQLDCLSKPTLREIGVTENQSTRWQQLASIPEADFEHAIDQAKIAGQELTRTMLHKIAKDQQQAERREERIAKVIAPLNTIGRFPLIYADPPWQYDFSVDDADQIENHYPTMPLEEICALNISEAATDDCVLFLWATSPKLPEALQVIAAWGFAYRTCAVWDKEWIGPGYYFRQRHELLLVATRGSLPVPLPSNRPDSVFAERRTAHSKKPEIAYQVIERMYPELPKLELFSRGPRDGWRAWGNEVSR